MVYIYIMNNNGHTFKERVFSAELIFSQLEKIFVHPAFAVSDIMRRFLSFIVIETLEGRSNQLKEYTIGVAVLNKPAEFKPQKDAIVRIHAGRLRRALDSYYQESPGPELVHISIPKGSYVPVFGRAIISDDVKRDTAATNGLKLNGHHLSNAIAVAVLPFSCFDKTQAKVSFAEGLATQLTTELSHIKNISVISYYSMHKLSDHMHDLKEVFSSVGAQYVFTGEIHHVKNRCRVYIQMIDVTSSEQLWSEQFEKEWTNTNTFEIQDVIVKEVATNFDHYLMDTQLAPASSDPEA